MGNVDWHTFIRQIILFNGAIFIKVIWISELIVLLSTKLNAYIINTLCTCLLLRVTIILHHTGLLWYIFIYFTAICIFIFASNGIISINNYNYSVLLISCQRIFKWLRQMATPKNVYMHCQMANHTWFTPWFTIIKSHCFNASHLKYCNNFR